MNHLKGKTVLIVDDSASVRQSLRAMYTSLGMNVVGEAENGVLALDFLTNAEIDLVSLDIIMPEMNGIECYQEIIAQLPDQKCIFFTYLAGDPLVMENLRKIIPDPLIFKKNLSAPDIAARLDRIMESTASTIAQVPGAA